MKHTNTIGTISKVSSALGPFGLQLEWWVM